MNISRRDLLRKMGAVSVLGAMGGWMRWAAAGEGAPPIDTLPLSATPPTTLLDEIGQIPVTSAPPHDPPLAAGLSAQAAPTTAAGGAGPTPPTGAAGTSPAPTPATGAPQPASTKPPGAAPGTTIGAAPPVTASARPVPTTAHGPDGDDGTSPPTAGAHATTTTAPRGSTATTATTAATSGAPPPSTTTTTTTAAPPPPSGSTSTLKGKIGPTTIPTGTTAKIVGDLTLGGDLIVEGTLTGIDTFRIDGNGYQILIQNGGSLDLRGVAKSGWVRGRTPLGWKTGDRVGTAPTAPGATAIGDIRLASWPTGAASVALIDGRAIAAEQFNLTRSIVIDNVARIMFHMGAGRSVLKHIAVTNSGVAGRLRFYPLHWHHVRDASRGTIVEGVVVENGRNHAFVPHASHGITFRDCVAYKIQEAAYWWDPPSGRFDANENTNDVLYQHCLAAGVWSSGRGYRLTAFMLEAGRGNRCIDCTAVAVQGAVDASGFQWPETANQNAGGNRWTFADCVAHNNKVHGIFTWQNDSSPHRIDRFIAYRNRGSGIDHGAYVNSYVYDRVLIQQSGEPAVQSHAVGRESGPIVFANVLADGPLLISKHSLANTVPVIYRNSRFTGIVVDEKDGMQSVQRFEDCGVTPASFDIRRTNPATVIQIVEGGAVKAEYRSGLWA